MSSSCSLTLGCLATDLFRDRLDEMKAQISSYSSEGPTDKIRNVSTFVFVQTDPKSLPTTPMPYCRRSELSKARSKNELPILDMPTSLLELSPLESVVCLAHFGCLRSRSESRRALPYPPRQAALHGACDPQGRQRAGRQCALPARWPACRTQGSTHLTQLA